MYNKQGEKVLVKLLSLLNIQHDEARVTIVFVFNIAFYSLLTFYLMKTYWTKSYNWRHKEHSHTTKFLDYDISIHSVMIKNLDGGIPVEKMTQTLRLVFDQLFPGGNKIIQCKALGKNDELFKLAKELREYKKELRYIRRLNRKSRDKALLKDVSHAVRKTIRKSKYCLCRRAAFDAEDFYLEKIDQVCSRIEKEKENSSKGNSGFGFVSFQSNLQVKKCLLTGHFKRMMMENLSFEDRLSSKCLSWDI